MKEHTVVRDLRYFGYFLSVVLLIGKWFGYFPYSYWAVFSPVWGIYAAAVIALVIAALIAAVGKGASKVRGG